MQSQFRAFVATSVLAAHLAGCASEAEPEPQVQAAEPLAPPRVAEQAKGNKIEVRKLELDRQIAETAGVLGAAADSDANQGETNGIGGLIGASGTQIGSGGLGASGTGRGGGGGLGGGGTVRGLGGAPSHGGVSGGVSVREVPTLPPAARAERFVDPGVNGFVSPSTDRVSTFSVDVDTGSYTISRRQLREGQLPPVAAVRVEEFVNYLDYPYAPPSDDAIFRVHTELAPSPFTAGHHVLKVGLKGREIPTANRPPVHLTFLVDVSGSMAGPDRLPLAQRALHYLVDNLGEEDTVAIATYAGANRRVLEPTHTTRATAIHDAIDSLSSGGGTAMASGMELAYEMALASYLEGAENRVLVLSDGDANIGASSHTEILKTIAGYAGRGITLSTFGFGTGNYQDAMMEQLADKGDGNYTYVDSMDEAKRVFGSDLTGTIRTIGRDVKIQVDFDPAVVQRYRLVGYENRDIADQDFRNDKVDAGEVGSGHQVTALYDLVLVEGATAPLGEVRLRAKPPGKDAAAREWSVPVSLAAAETFDAAGADSRLAFGVASFAEKLRGSPHVADVGYDRILRIVQDATSSEREDHRELIELIQRAAKLSGQPIGVPTAAR